MIFPRQGTRKQCEARKRRDCPGVGGDSRPGGEIPGPEQRHRLSKGVAMRLVGVFGGNRGARRGVEAPPERLFCGSLISKASAESEEYLDIMFVFTWGLKPRSPRTPPSLASPPSCPPIAPSSGQGPPPPVTHSLDFLPASFKLGRSDLLQPISKLRELSQRFKVKPKGH